MGGRRRSWFSSRRMLGLACEHLERVVVEPGGQHQLHEHRVEALGQRPLHPPVEAEDAAEGALAIRGQRELEGVVLVGAHGHAAGVVVLDDRHRRQLELVHQPATGVHVQQVVERQLLAVQLGDHREQVGSRSHLGVVGGALVGVLAVGKLEHLLERGGELPGEVVLALGEPAGDGGVVARRVGEGLEGEALAGAIGQPPVALAQLLEHRVVALGRDHHRREVVVLGRGPDQRGPADVDVLDHLAGLHPALGRHPLEGVEVHAHQVDGLDLVLVQRVHVLLARAHREEPGVDARVKRLDPAVEDLGEAGVALHRADRDALGLELAGGAAGGHDLHPELGEPAGEVRQTPLVGHRQERPADLDLARRRGLGRATRRGHLRSSTGGGSRRRRAHGPRQSA